MNCVPFSPALPYWHTNVRMHSYFKCDLKKLYEDGSDGELQTAHCLLHLKRWEHTVPQVLACLLYLFITIALYINVHVSKIKQYWLTVSTNGQL